MSLVLASSSAIRRALLDQAGVGYEVVPPSADEDPIQAAHDRHDDRNADRLPDPSESAV